MDQCAECKLEATLQCVKCKSVKYCSKECQKKNWKTHKPECKEDVKHKFSWTVSSPGSSSTVLKENPKSTARAAATFGHANSSWASGLSNREKYEWFVDCYRMRSEDEYKKAGHHRVGIYEVNASPFSVMMDLYVFCMLAVERNVLPSNWEWPEFLDVALRRVPFALKASEAEAKYGPDPLHQRRYAGRSLRHTASVIYSRDDGPDLAELEDENDADSTMLSWKFHVAANMNCQRRDRFWQTRYFQNIGGVKIWKDFWGELTI